MVRDGSSGRLPGTGVWGLPSRLRSMGGEDLRHSCTHRVPVVVLKSPRDASYMGAFMSCNGHPASPQVGAVCVVVLMFFLIVASEIVESLNFADPLGFRTLRGKVGTNRNSQPHDPLVPG